jgi:hypothetical protein
MGIKKKEVRKFERRNCHIVLLFLSLVLLNTHVSQIEIPLPVLASFFVLKLRNTPFLIILTQ